MPSNLTALSTVPTPFRLLCDEEAGGCGAKSYITLKAYNAAMRDHNSRWKCPVCGNNSWFDDENLEDANEE